MTSAITTAVAHDGRAARYKRMYPRLADALVNGGGNCVALSTLAAALAHDAGRGDVASFRVYTNHVAPDVAGFHFGMVKRCHGEGVKLAARDLLGAYATARFTGDREPFAFPPTDDTCDDPGDVFGDLQIVSADPPALPREEKGSGGAAAPSRAAGAARAPSTLFPSPSSPREVQCRRRTVGRFVAVCIGGLRRAARHRGAPCRAFAEERV